MPDSGARSAAADAASVSNERGLNGRVPEAENQTGRRSEYLAR